MTDLDRIIASRAVDKTAARVTGKGEHWEPRKRLIQPCDAWRDTPLPTFPVPPDAPRLVGLKAGRLTVVGYGGKGAGKARWVVRCACGAYGHQSAKSLRAPDAARRACPHCDYLNELKARRTHARVGGDR